MSIFAWIILGLVADYIASKIVNKRGDGLIRDMILGIVGAVVGGWLFRTLGASGVTGLNIYSLVVAVVGPLSSCWSTTPSDAQPETSNDRGLRISRAPSSPRLHRQVGRWNESAQPYISRQNSVGIAESNTVGWFLVVWVTLQLRDP